MAARFDVNRIAPSLVSLEHTTDPVGKVIGFYAKTSDDKEVFISEEFVREHFTVAPKIIATTVEMPPASSTVKMTDLKPAK